MINLNENKLKLNWHSNAPWTSVGYGNQTRLFVPRIKALGYPISITAFYGLQGGIGNFNGIRVYPVGKHPYGQDVIGASAVFDGANAIITLMDAWVVQPDSIPPHIGWYPWFPIDCEPIPANVLNHIRQARKPIVLSKFGQKMTEQAGVECYYVPHGVETDIFRPIARAAAFERLKWPKDKFIVGMVAANKGNPPRKAFFEQIAGFAALHRAHPDTMLYLHTDDGRHGGNECVDLVRYCEVLGLRVGYMTDNPVGNDIDVVFADQYMLLLGMPDPYMVDVYNALDVMLLASRGEGFGIPLIEAQACGCPVITGEWTAMGELMFSGWHIKKNESDQEWQTFFEAWQWRCRPEVVADRLSIAYEVKGNQDYRKRARDGAMAYDADRVANKFWRPVLADMEQNMFELPKVKLVQL
jgi:glycosyltransferase involved in cell wall biosynthesis